MLDEVKRLRDLRQAATPGEWHNYYHRKRVCRNLCKSAKTNTFADIDFIAAAANLDLDALIERMEGLQAENERLREQLRRAHDWLEGAWDKAEEDPTDVPMALMACEINGILSGSPGSREKTMNSETTQAAAPVDSPCYPSNAMYRERWVADILGDRSVLSVALDVHMTTTGSAERHPDDQERDIVALREVENSWKNHGICDFDDAVLHLIRVAIREAGHALTSEVYSDG